MFGPLIERWSLEPDGEPIATRSSRLLPVRWRGLPAMLKIARMAEEKSGGRLMRWCDGHGAARVFAEAGDAILLERAESRRSLFHLAMTGSDDAATRIICRTVAMLHAPRATPLPELVPLDRWFEALEPAARAHGGIFEICAGAARFLFTDPHPPTVLHGDIHHGNILDFGARGWLAIDPKGLYGDRGFDYANLFCNPELPVVTAPGRLQKQFAIVLTEARLEAPRLLRWILAYAGLSAAWFLQDGESAENNLVVAEIAAAELNH
ncbi:aminoglycoside phosphotransferase family protein [Sinorhizobium numidicum]|uniref:Aminoglycoside phosphotransferase family protein n=1 Tax=Sinorhizobium numidicum TaxID=680248 RepID=A0ABY8CX99_9HYPH|nr:aminoglycoside phosphotransferase family protein [Sinorhizobium numidicum]WEX75853.1 aminoglycoside phosphotransferase family protein [Sinorhizobium numidicum]WEX82512.1 aminoglycoside phosphotransferase family protein [Sinorhizobium numidicum]